MPRTGDAGKRKREKSQARANGVSLFAGHGEPTAEEVRIYVNMVAGGRKTNNTAVNYVYAYKTKARAFESINDASQVR